MTVEFYNPVKVILIMRTWLLKYQEVHGLFFIEQIQGNGLILFVVYLLEMGLSIDFIKFVQFELLMA